MQDSMKLFAVLLQMTGSVFFGKGFLNVAE